MIGGAFIMRGGGAVKLHLPTMSVWPIVLFWALGAASAGAIPVSHLEVRVVTGADELSAGSSLELRIYEAGRSVRRLPLVHGEAWPRDSTHIIPVKLSEALDPTTDLPGTLSSNLVAGIKHTSIRFTPSRVAV